MIPFLRPDPPSLAGLLPELRRIEDSRIFSNSGPTNTAFERELRDAMFGGVGGCVTVCNATLGLMLAIRAVLSASGLPGAIPGSMPAAGPAAATPRYALMPSFTFAATAQAAIWNGLTPLLCDSRASDWSADPASEEALIARHGEHIAVIVPYATLGTHIDLDRYAALGRRTGIPVVVDAATSLGSTGPAGVQFGTGSPLPVVFSMHATKTFGTAEGGVVYCADPALLRRIRSLASFGFEAPRSASLPGLNAKLSEVHALLALARLRGFDAVMRRRTALADEYHRGLPGWRFQEEEGRRSGCSFMSVLLPPHAPDRADVVAALARRGIGAAGYFSPHLAQQPLFASCPRAELPVADDIAARVLSLPIWDGLSATDVRLVCATLREIVPFAVPPAPPSRFRSVGR